MNPLQLKLRAADANAGTFTGLAATFGPMPDRQGDLILPGAFDTTLAEWAARSFNLPLLAGHDQDQPIGAVYGAITTPDGLLVSGRIVTSTAAGADAYALAMAGALSLSIGYTVPVGGAQLVGNVRQLSAIDLHEISVVSVPANADARITEIKRADQCQTVRQYEALVREALGLSNRTAKAVASKTWPLVNPRDGGDPQRDVAPAITQKAVAILAASTPSKR